MNRLFFMIALLFIFIVPQAWGQTTQYANPYRQTTWNNVTDGIHTFGQNAQQKKATLTKLHYARTTNRIQGIMKDRKAKMHIWQNNQ